MAKIILIITRFLILSLLASLSSLSLSVATDNPKYKTTKYKTVAQAKVTRKNIKDNNKNKTQATCKSGQCKSCYDTIYKPLWCDESLNQPTKDHHVPESMGPHGYNYDGIPWYLDDGYSHYNSFW